MPRKTKEEAEQTRLLLLSTALEVMSQKGVSKTTLNDIAKAAGLTKGAIYWHFNNKAQLMDEVITHYSQQVDEESERVMEEQEHPIKKILAGVDYYFAQLEASDDLQRVYQLLYHKCEFTEEMSVLIERMKTDLQHAFELFSTPIEQAQSQGLIGSDTDKENVVRGLIILVNGLMELWTFQQADWSIRQQAQLQLGIYLRGLGWEGE
ncbi:TetR family transcriptional regulator [Pleionea sp. CnH1-48]|uniref:TetR family transcriptional regulator n=1 Tax=Pleionea sp. CnH1-48 TaxID=2954494 RepID=UPI002097D57F|nr:TetR family transcriptional regulator [Pleionea sp. CnH1-48]MCO7223351.1 TetR family transcriptional regulator [Pleionea sp. CnH1-48]